MFRVASQSHPTHPSQTTVLTAFNHSLRGRFLPHWHAQRVAVAAFVRSLASQFDGFYRTRHAPRDGFNRFCAHAFGTG
eukprot:389934-Pleurochrysis_carterae.AAC.1